MNKEIKPSQAAGDITKAPQSCRQGNRVETRVEADRPRPEFNRYIYENLISNFECQLEYWNRKAERQVDPQVAQALQLKAEGLGHALRLLNAFEPEFRELVECASRAVMDGTIQC